MLAHIILAVLMQLGIRALTRSWAAGTAAACAWAIAREVAQAEYRWIEAFGAGRRANMPWWGGLDPRVWQRADPWFDWLVPCTVVLAVWIVAIRRSATTPANERD